MAKATTISINAEVNEILKNIQQQESEKTEYEPASISSIANRLICIGLNVKYGEETGINYLDLLGRKD